LQIPSGRFVFAGLTFLLAGAFSAHPQDQAAGSASPQVIEVSAKKYEFNPSEIHVKKGAKVQLKMHTLDVTHGFKLDASPEGSKDKSKPGLTFSQPEDNLRIEKDKDLVVEFVAQQAGTYEFKCNKVCGFGHRHMKGKLVVDE